MSEKEKQKLGLATEDDGEFWMAWDDFVMQFTDISINHLINTSLFSFSKTWKEVSIQGNWTRPDRAGGCLNHPASFLSNPQYRFDLPGREDEEVVLQLSQWDDPGLLTRVERDKLVIGFHLLQVEANREYRLHRRVSDSDSGTSDYIRSRHVFLRRKLRPGRYVLIPTSFDPGKEGRFLLRLFSSKVSGLLPLLLDKPPSPCLLTCGLGSFPCLVSRLTVQAARGLEKKDLVGCECHSCFLALWSLLSSRGPLRDGAVRGPQLELGAGQEQPQS